MSKNYGKCPHCNQEIKRKSMTTMKQEILDKLGYDPAIRTPGNALSVNEVAKIYNHLFPSEGDTKATSPRKINK